MPQAQVCKHLVLTSTAYLAHIVCTACGVQWAKNRDGHMGTKWQLEPTKGGDTRNDVHVSQESPKSRRVSRSDR